MSQIYIYAQQTTEFSLEILLIKFGRTGAARSYLEGQAQQKTVYIHTILYRYTD